MTPSSHKLRPLIPILSLCFLLLPLFVIGQAEIKFQPQDTDGSVTFHIDSLEQLKPVVRSEEAEKAKIPLPHYEYLWVFSDGEFINQSKEDTITHIFIGEEGRKVPGGAVAFTTGVYSDDHLDLPPSERAIGGNTPDSIVLKDRPRQEVVADGLIRLSNNQRGFVAGDKSVFIVSLKNPYDTRLQMHTLLFAGPVIETKLEGPLKGEVQYEVYADEGGKPSSAIFEKSLELDPLDTNFTAPPVDNRLLTEDMKQRYNKVYRLPPVLLDSGEMRHRFIEFDVDTALFSKGPEKEKGALRFTAAVMVGQLPSQDGLLSAQDSALIENLGIQELVDTLGAEDLFTGNLVADMSSYEGEITRSHDPNYVVVEACACPQGSDGAYKLFCTVHFSNEGVAETNDISVSITFPPEFDIFSIPDTLLSLYPDPGSPLSPVRDAATNTVRWDLDGFQLFPEADFGLGHPLTYGEFQFTVLANPAGGALAAIPYLQACIVFDGQAEVCTVPVKPVEVESAGAAEVLQCVSCVSDGPPNGGGMLPWWLWLLLLLVLIVLLIIAAIRRRMGGS